MSEQNPPANPPTPPAGGTDLSLTAQPAAQPVQSTVDFKAELAQRLNNRLIIEAANARPEPNVIKATEGGESPSQIPE